MYWPSPDDDIANPKPTSSVTKTLYPRVNQQPPMPVMMNCMEDVQPQNVMLWTVVSVRNWTDICVGPYKSFQQTIAASTLNAASFLPG